MIVYESPTARIFGKKTIIRNIEQKDLHRSIRWLKDPKVNKYLSQDFAGLDEKQENEWFSFVQRSKNDIAFAIDTANGLHIGNCGLNKIDWIGCRAEFGIVIGEKKYWNKGYGTDAVSGIINFAIRNLGLKSLTLNVYEYNKRAIRVYRKCGFKIKKILKKDHSYNNKHWDTYVMEYVSRGTGKA